MTDRYDVIVLGLGGMGSAAAAHLAARGQRVLGLEQFTPAHALGSSHGESRVIRQSYFEDPAYVPLLQRAYELWADLDAEQPGILTLTGGLMLGTPDAATVAGSLASARQWDLPHDLLDASQLRARFPNFAPSDTTVGFYEDRAGFVRPELTVRTHLRRAAAAGADLHFEETARFWRAEADGVAVQTAFAEYRAERLAITPGAWAPTVLADLQLPLAIERQVLHWFAPIDGVEAFRAPRQPVFIWHDETGLQLYGFPAYGAEADGVKVAFFRGGPTADPDRLDRAIHPGEIESTREWLARHIPTLAGEYLRGVACMYTNTPDEHFLIARHPRHEQVTIAAGFSGHGFKFVPVVGEIVADLVLDGSTEHPIELFAPSRFG